MLSDIKAKVNRSQQDHMSLGLPFAVLKKYSEDKGSQLAALISYYTFFSIFPLLLALVSILGFLLVGNEELQKDIEESALAQLPVVGDQLLENVGSLDGNIFALITGLLLALWAGMRMMVATQSAMNKIWDVPLGEQPKFVAKRLRSLTMLAVIGGALIGSVVVTGLAGRVTWPGVGKLLIFAGAFATTAFTLALAFKLLVEEKVSFKDVLPGALVGAGLHLGLQSYGGYLVRRFIEGASDTYGVFAFVIGLLTWLYVLALATLIAAEINPVVKYKLWPRSLTDQPTEADRRVDQRRAQAATLHS